jgi:hypothetical protein
VNELKNEFFPGTRKELFKELEQWSTGDFPPDNRKRFSFRSGGAGLGKSSISHQLCTRLDASSAAALGASFFFVQGHEASNLGSTRLFFPRVAHQLALSQPDTLRPHIISAARKHCKGGDPQQMKYAFKELLQKPLAGAIVKHTPIVIIINGLDECEDRELVPALLDFLLKLVRALSWVGAHIY